MAIVNVYQVVYHDNRHNGANAAKMTALVSAASGDPRALASTIQTNNADGKTVTVESATPVLTGVIQ